MTSRPRVRRRWPPSGAVGAFRSRSPGVLLAVSVWIRLKLNGSPAFLKIKSEGKTSKAPLTESFGQWKNLRIVLLALFGLTAGQAVVWTHRPVLCALLFADLPEGSAAHGQHPDRGVAHLGHAVLRDLRFAVGPHWPQAHHHGRLPDCGAHLLSAVRRAHQAGQPPRSRRPSRNHPSRWCPIQPIATSCST